MPMRKPVWMGVGDEIFPREQKAAYVQTQWSKGWGYGVIGFGYAARMLTEQREKMHANVDQIALAVFYLQRHRVELVIKQALVDLGSAPVDVAKLGHNLETLWRSLEEVVRSVRVGLWGGLRGAGRPAPVVASVASGWDRLWLESSAVARRLLGRGLRDECVKRLRGGRAQLGAASMRLVTGPRLALTNSKSPCRSRSRHSTSVRSLPPTSTSMIRSRTFP